MIAQKNKIAKSILLILLFSSVFSLNAQTVISDTLYLAADSLKKDRVKLDMTWRYHSGDDSLWASPEFDHSSWDTTRTYIKITDSTLIVLPEVGWYRKWIVVDSALVNKSLLFVLRHYGASEIYVNGESRFKFGNVFTDTSAEEAYMAWNEPMIVSLDSSNTYLLAVRFSNKIARENPRWFRKWIQSNGFELRIGDSNIHLNDFILNRILSFGINGLIGGLFISLFALYFLLFLFYSRKKENLYYSLFTLGLGIILLFSVVRQFIHGNLILYVFFTAFPVVMLVVIFGSYLGFLYSIFYKKIPRVSWVFTAFAILVMGFLTFSVDDNLINIFLGTYVGILTLEGLRVIIMAIYKKRKYAWIVGLGVLFFVLLIVVFLIAGIFEIELSGIVAIVIFFTGLFGLPLSMSIYLARTIAETNHDLEEQLVTVKDLSAKELEHQKKNAEMAIHAEKERASAEEAKLRTKAAELQAKAAEAQARALQVENERKSKELEEARQLQLSMLPQELPELPNVDIAVYMQTATEVGGDYYDFHVEEDGTLTVVFGDATGHGINAGMVVTATKSLFNAEAGNPDIVKTMALISRSLSDMNLRFLFMCLILLKIKDYVLHISSGGMPPLLIHRHDTAKVEEILIKGLPLGSKLQLDYEDQKVPLKKGDTILLYSDGFPELFDEQNEMFGYDQVSEVFAEIGDGDPESIIEALKEQCASWAPSERPNDDVTFVVIKIK